MPAPRPAVSTAGLLFVKEIEKIPGESAQSDDVLQHVGAVGILGELGDGGALIFALGVEFRVAEAEKYLRSEDRDFFR